MKRLTLLTAAGLLASAPLFAMEGGGVSISGEANFGVKFAESDDDSKNDLQFHHEFDVKFSASGTTDGGIGFGGSMSIDNTESVSRGKVNAAKTGYIVTETDLTAAGLKALADKYGIDPSALKEGDVIESGNKTNFSGYGKAKIASHLDADDNPLFDGTPATPGKAAVNYVMGDTVSGVVIYAANVAAGLDDDEERGGPDGIANVFLVREAGDNGQTVWRTTTAGAGDTLIASGRIVRPDTTGTLAVAAIPETDGNTDEIATLPRVPAVPAGGGNGIILIDTVAAGQAANTGIKTPAIVPVDAVDPTAGETAIKVARSQAYIDDLNTSVTDADKHSVDNHGEVYISMDMHKLTIGSDLDAADMVAGGLADPGFDGIGIDDVAEGPYGESVADVRYDGDFGVASVAISYGDNKGDADWAAGFSFNVEPVTFGAGFDNHGVMSIGMGFTQGLISMNALYSTDSDHDEADNEAIANVANAQNKAHKDYIAKSGNLDATSKVGNKPDLKNQAMGVDMTYQMSDTTSIVLVAAQHKKESARWSQAWTGTTLDDIERDPANDKWVKSSTTVDAFGVGFSHDLGGGATLKAGAGSVDSNAVADLGITMKF